MRYAIVAVVVPTSDNGYSVNLGLEIQLQHSSESERSRATATHPQPQLRAGSKKGTADLHLHENVFSYCYYHHPVGDDE